MKYLLAIVLSLSSQASFAEPKLNIINIRKAPVFDQFAVSIKNESDQRVFCKEIRFPVTIAEPDNCGADVVSSESLSLFDVTYDPQENKSFKDLGKAHFDDVSKRVNDLMGSDVHLVYCPITSPIWKDCGNVCADDGTNYNFGAKWQKEVDGGKINKFCSNEGKIEIESVQCGDPNRYIATSDACVPRGCPGKAHGETWTAPLPNGSSSLSCNFGETVVNSVTCGDGYENIGNACSPRSCRAETLDWPGNILQHGASVVSPRSWEGGNILLSCNLGKLTRSLSCNPGYKKVSEMFAGENCTPTVCERFVFGGSPGLHPIISIGPNVPIVIVRECTGNYVSLGLAGSISPSDSEAVRFFKTMPELCANIPPAARTSQSLRNMCP